MVWGAGLKECKVWMFMKFRVGGFGPGFVAGQGLRFLGVLGLEVLCSRKPKHRSRGRLKMGSAKQHCSTSLSPLIPEAIQVRILNPTPPKIVKCHQAYPKL